MPKQLLDPAPLVGVATLGDSAVHIAARPWVSLEDYGAVGGELSVAIIETCRRRGITIALPQREVRLIGGG